MKKILLIGMGGTIASLMTEDGLSPEMTPDQLLKYVPEISNFCHVETTTVCTIDSTNITPKHWIDTANTIKKEYDNYDGFVISHGTDTMAYTSAAISYLVQSSPKPIIITGAQKPINYDTTDSKVNLSDAFICACSDSINGVHIAFNGKLILGTRARKTHSKSFYAFSSINYPFVAVLQDSYLLQYIKTETDGFPIFSESLDPSVALLKMMPGMDIEVLKFMLENKKAVIIESFGVGGLPTYKDQDFSKLIEEYTEKGRFIIMTSQVENEGSDLSVYHVGNGLSKNPMVLEAYDMTTESVIAKTMWILAKTKNPKEFRNLFYSPIANDILYNPETKK